MPFEQAIRLVTQPPESLAYHLIILLSLQVTFSVALWQWRYDGEAVDSWRLWIAAGLMFLLRLGTAVALTASNDLGQKFLLPPLERAIDLATVLLLLWAIIPSLRSFPRLTDSLLLISLIGVGLGYGLSGVTWNRLFLDGAVYQDTNQASIWAIVHLVFLTAGLIWLIVRRPFDWFLRALILIPLVAAQGLLLAKAVPSENFIESLPVEVATLAIPFWMRLAYVLSFPILASLAYRQNLAGLLFSRNSAADSLAAIEALLDSTNSVLAAPSQGQLLEEAAALFFDRIKTAFVAFGVRNSRQPELLNMMVFRSSGGQAQEATEWTLNSSNWTALEMAVRDDNLVELASSGLGARQYFDLKRELDLSIEGPILISPINRSLVEAIEDEVLDNLGVILLGKAAGDAYWEIAERQLVRPLARFLGRALSRQEGEIRFVEIPSLEKSGELPSPAEIAELEREASAALTLRKEVSLLRESLRTAEEALAVASAGESGLSTEWVTRAITHYSGELEESQLKISQLEDQLQSIVSGPAFDSLVFLSEEIRTPVTAIQGYVGVLLADREVKLPFEFRHLLERVQKSAQKIDELMERFDQNVQQVGSLNNEIPQARLVDVVEMAVEALKSNLRDKRLTIDLDFADQLPDVHLLARDLYHLAILVLRLIIESAENKSRLMIKGHAVEGNHYIQFEIRISDPEVVHKLKLELLHDKGRPGKVLSANGDGELSEPSLYQLIKRYQTRIWVDSQPGSGTVVIFLLPVVPHLIKE